MALRLIVGNLNYSSWSMRPWLALSHARADFKLHDIGLKADADYKERILQFSGAGKVPVLVDGSLSVHESLAISEYVAELHPEAKLWPEDRKLRARGRAISSEMVSSFTALRSQAPSNLRERATKPPPSDPATLADIQRVFDIWTASLTSSGGPFLLGEVSIADFMYFPVAARFRTYGVKLPELLATYSATLCALPAVQELEKIAATTPAIPEYDAALTA